MAKLFQLHRQRAATLHRHRQLQFRADIKKRRFERPVPLNDWILPRRHWPVEVAVFQEQKGLDQERWDVIDPAEKKVGLGVAKQLHAVGADDFQSGSWPFRIRRRDAAIQKRQHGFRLAHLLVTVALGLQTGLKSAAVWNTRVARRRARPAGK